MKFLQALKDMNADLNNIEGIQSHVSLAEQSVLEAHVKFAHHYKMRATLNL